MPCRFRRAAVAPDAQGVDLGRLRQPAASGLAAQHGGRVLRFAEVRPELVDLSGGALHDGRM